MGNRLKKIFSDTPDDNVSILNLEFINAEARQQFIDAVHKVTNDENGIPVQVDGIRKIKTYYEAADSKYPIDEAQPIVGSSIIYQYKEPILLPVQVSQKEINLKFERSYTDDCIIIQNDKKSVVYIKIIINKKKKDLKINCQRQPNNASTIEEIIDEYSKSVAFFDRYIIIKSQNDGILKIKKNLQLAINHFNKMLQLNKMFGITISPQDLSAKTNNNQTVEILYEFLVKHTILKSNSTINYITSQELPNSSNFKVGNRMQLVFTNSEVYNYFDHPITVYYAEYAFNIIISKIEKDSNSQYIVYFTDLDTEPMLLSRKGFLSLEKAEEELSTMENQTDSYKNAKTMAEILKLEYEAL